jgi:plastocyanin
VKQRILLLAVAIAVLSIGFANAACYINVVEENKSQYDGDLNATMTINNQTTPYSAEIELSNETLEVFPNATMTTILLNVPADQIESAISEAGNWSIVEIDEQGQTNTIITAEIDENTENASGPVTINFNDSWDGTFPENDEGYVIAVDIENIGEMEDDNAWVTLGFCDEDTPIDDVPVDDEEPVNGEEPAENVTNVTTCYLNIVEENKTQYDGDLNATMIVNNETTPYTAEIELTNDTQETFPNATLTTIVLNVPADQIVNANDTLGNEWEITEIVEEEPNPFGNFTTMLTMGEDMMNPFGQFITKITINETDSNATGPVTIYFDDSWNGTFPANEDEYVIAANIEDIGEMGDDSAWVTLGFCETEELVEEPPVEEPPVEEPPVEEPPVEEPPVEDMVTLCYINDVEDNKSEYEGNLNATMMVSNETAPYFIEIELTNETIEMFPNTTIETILFNIPVDQIDNVTASYGNWSLVDLSDNRTVIERFEADENNNTTDSGPITIYLNETWNGTLPANEEGYVISVDFQNIGEMGDDSAWVTLGFCEASNLTDDNVTDDNVTDDNVTDDNVTDDNVTDDNVTDDNATDENDTDADAELTQVEIIEDNFDPETAMVMVGGTVTWTNMDVESHTVTAEDGMFDSGEIAPGESFSYVFEEAGIFDYYCTIHPEMNGSVIVEENSA